MEKFLPIFNPDESDKYIVLLALTISVFIPAIPLIILWFVKDEINPSAHELLKALFNYGLFIGLIALILAVIFIPVSWIPIINLLVGFLSGIISLIIWLVNLLVVLRVILAILNRTAVSVPVFKKFLK